MTQTTEQRKPQPVILPDGRKGTIYSPAHLLLRRMAGSVHGYVQRGRGASDTQLRALARDNHVRLHHERDGARLVVVGAYLTPSGEKYVEALDRAAERVEYLASL
jgi:hypothetical protein